MDRLALTDQCCCAVQRVLYWKQERKLLTTSSGNFFGYIGGSRSFSGSFGARQSFDLGIWERDLGCLKESKFVCRLENVKRLEEMGVLMKTNWLIQSTMPLTNDVVCECLECGPSRIYLVVLRCDLYINNNLPEDSGLSTRMKP